MTFHAYHPEQVAAENVLIEQWRESDTFTQAFLEWAEQQPDLMERFEFSDAGARAFETWCDQ